MLGVCGEDKVNDYPASGIFLAKLRPQEVFWS